MKKMHLRFWCLLAVLFSLAACDETKPVDPEPEKSDKAAMLKLSFNTSDNPGMASNSTGVTANGYYCISITEGLDRAKLVPDLQVSDKASAFIDGKPYTLTLSIGVARWEPSMSAKDFIESADNQLYEIKRNRPPRH